MHIHYVTMFPLKKLMFIIFLTCLCIKYLRWYKTHYFVVLIIKPKETTKYEMNKKHTEAKCGFKKTFSNTTTTVVHYIINITLVNESLLCVSFFCLHFHKLYLLTSAFMCVCQLLCTLYKWGRPPNILMNHFICQWLLRNFRNTDLVLVSARMIF